MNKRVLLIFLGSFALGFIARGDERSTAIIKKTVDKLSALPAYEVRFTARSASEMPTTEGYYLVAGENYYMTLGDKSVYADGKTKHEIDDTKREVVISAVEKKDRNILSNPTRAFDFLDGAFTHSLKGTATVSSRQCSEIELLPTDKSNPVRSITLFIDSNSTPVALSYQVEGMRAPIEININSLVPLQKADKSRFTFPREKYKGYEMIDFR